MSKPAETPGHRPVERLAGLAPGTRGVVAGVVDGEPDRAERLAALGVTAGASVTMLQAFPVVVFLCDQTELAVEPAIARAVLVEVSGEDPVGPIRDAEASRKSS